MKINFFILYIKKKKKLKKLCNNCFLCITICPKKKIKIKKKLIFNNCNVCRYCLLNCNYNCIK